MPRGAVVSISHGGGPMPVLGDPGHADLVRSLTKKVPALLKLNTPAAPRAIVVVTAHWSTAQPTVSTGAHHDLYYDYGGFPPEAYELKYPAPGSPEVAREVKAALDAVGFKTAEDSKRGWDHGVFIPLLLINPAANIPIVQLSVLQSEDAAAHLRMGRALATLRDANVAIVGSGFASLHNFRLMFALRDSGAATARAVADVVRVWNAALTEAVVGGGEAAEEEREARMVKWREFPNAYEAHPRGRAEHFLPLLVCVGAAAGEKGTGYVDDWHGADIWSFYWE
ncbi:unnamed protein product [Discula destructiva]